jgi:phosphoesterase RecJ-like protein
VNVTRTDLTEVADALRSHERFVVTTHENPDGDALGSLLATELTLRALGKEATAFLAGDVPLPNEYRFMPLDDLERGDAPDLAGRVLVAVDCANESRLGREPERILGSADLVVNIDHHHDNSRFGGVNLIVADASSTGEILRDVLRELDVALTPGIAEALYIAIVTDTGRFQYSNTSAKSLRLAAELVDAGANVHRIFQGVYENVAFAKLKLVARALDRARLLEDGRVIVSYLERGDFGDVGAEEPFSEGIIDYLRAVDGAELAALIREPPSTGGPKRRISLRTTEEGLDVSAIARKSGGGGHRQAAGFQSEASVDEIVDFIVREYRAQAAARA